MNYSDCFTLEWVSTHRCNLIPHYFSTSIHNLNNNKKHRSRMENDGRILSKRLLSLVNAKRAKPRNGKASSRPKSIFLIETNSGGFQMVSYRNCWLSVNIRTYSNESVCNLSGICVGDSEWKVFFFAFHNMILDGNWYEFREILCTYQMNG